MTDNDVTIVEDLSKTRQPHPEMDAIYLCYPAVVVCDRPDCVVCAVLSLTTEFGNLTECESHRARLHPNAKVQNGTYLLHRHCRRRDHLDDR